MIIYLICFLFSINIVSSGCIASGNFAINWITDQQNISFRVFLPIEHKWSSFAINNSTERNLDGAIIFMYQDNHLNFYIGEEDNKLNWLGELNYSKVYEYPGLMQVYLFSYPLSVWKNTDFGIISLSWSTETKIQSIKNFTMNSILKQESVFIQDKGKAHFDILNI